MKRHGLLWNHAWAACHDLRTYVREIVDVIWPAQTQGIVLNDTDRVLRDFEQRFKSYEMPGPLRTLLMLGALVCIAVTWYFQTASPMLGASVRATERRSPVR